MARAIEFYFDFLSPYAYLAHTQLPSIATRYGCSITYRPIDLQKVKLAVGNTGPSTREMPVKHRYMRQDLQRWASIYGVPFKGPAGYGSYRLNCIAYLAIERGCAREYVDTVWNLIWGQGGAMNGDGLLMEAVNSLSWDMSEVLSYVNDASGEQRIAEGNELAISRGVFGVPTMLIDDQMWWGNDRLSLLEDYLKEGAK